MELDEHVTGFGGVSSKTLKKPEVGSQVHNLKVICVEMKYID